MRRGRVYYCHQCQMFHGMTLMDLLFVRETSRPSMYVKGGIKTCSRCKQSEKRRKAGVIKEHNPLRRFDKIRNKLSMLH